MLWHSHAIVRECTPIYLTLMNMIQLHYKNTMCYNDFAAMFVQSTKHSIFNAETFYVYLKFHVLNAWSSHCGVH
jgi:hypothetical protein